MKQKYINTIQWLGLGLLGLCLVAGMIGFDVLAKPIGATILPTVSAEPQGEEKKEDIPKSETYKECEGGGDCQNKMFEYINFVIAALSAMAGVIFVIMVVWGGIEYSSAGGDPQKVAAAKSKVTNAIIGLIAFGLLYGFLSWIVPGGIG